MLDLPNVQLNETSQKFSLVFGYSKTNITINISKGLFKNSLGEKIFDQIFGTSKFKPYRVPTHSK